MRPYPINKISISPITPVYKDNNISPTGSRYVINRIIDNLPNKALEIRILSGISNNPSYKGYYYTTKENETLYSISKKYYNDESLYWILAKANGLKNKGLTIIPKDTTLVIPDYGELQVNGGYYRL